MIRRPPRSTRTDTLFPYTTLFRSLGPLHLLAAVLVLPPLAGRNAQVGNLPAVLEALDLGIGPKVADQDNFVDAAHAFEPSSFLATGMASKALEVSSSAVRRPASAISSAMRATMRSDVSGHRFNATLPVSP